MADTRKIKLAMLYLAHKQNWMIDIYQVTKLIELADELHDCKWGEGIAERFCTGVESSELLSSMKDNDDLLFDPREFIKDDKRDSVTLEMIIDELSVSETEALDTAYKYLVEDAACRGV